VSIPFLQVKPSRCKSITLVHNLKIQKILKPEDFLKTNTSYRTIIETDLEYRYILRR
jgi:hypothetical protein